MSKARNKEISMNHQSASLDDLTYQIRRSARRRTIGIEVREGQVIVRAPVGIPEARLHRLVQRKRSWVRAKLTAQQALMAKIPEHSFTQGSQLPWLGGSLVLDLEEGSPRSVVRNGDRLRARLGQRSHRPVEERSREAVTRWYRETALELLRDKSQRLANRMGLTVQAVRVRATRSKWGHCTSRGVLQYNWQIVLAPEPVVDYLVAHEVCHLQHLNHSQAFWQLVASVCPDYRAQRDWLKKQGPTLVL